MLRRLGSASLLFFHRLSHTSPGKVEKVGSDHQLFCLAGLVWERPGGKARETSQTLEDPSWSCAQYFGIGHVYLKKLVLLWDVSSSVMIHQCPSLDVG